MIFLGHIVGNGQVKPVLTKIQSTVDYAVPRSKQELMCFLGMASYYRRFAFVNKMINKKQRLLRWSLFYHGYNLNI